MEAIVLVGILCALSFLFGWRMALKNKFKGHVATATSQRAELMRRIAGLGPESYEDALYFISHVPFQLHLHVLQEGRDPWELYYPDIRKLMSLNPNDKVATIKRIK